MKKYFILFFFCFSIFSCEKPKYTIIPNVSNIEGKKTGIHSVYYDKSQWKIEKNYNYFKCTPNNFKIDININTFFNQYIEKYLNSNFINVIFFEEPMTLDKFNESDFDTYIEIKKKNAFVKFSYDGDISRFFIKLDGSVSLLDKKGGEFKSSIYAEGIGKKENFFNCDPKITAKIAYENALSKFLSLIFKKINTFIG